MRLLFSFGRQANATGPIWLQQLCIIQTCQCLTLPPRQACNADQHVGVHMGLKNPFGRCCCTCMAKSPCAAPVCQKEPQWTHTSQHHLGLVCWTPTWQTWVCWTAAHPLLGQLPADLSCLKPGMHHLASSSQPCNKDKCVALAACRIGVRGLKGQQVPS